MSGQQEIPWRWAERLIERGFEKERGEGASVARLAEAAGLHTTTVTNALLGQGRPKPRTVRALCEQLGDDVAQWFGVERPRDWVPPDEAALLTDRQRLAIEEVIRAMTDPRGERDGTPIGGVRAKRVRARRPAPLVSPGEARPPDTPAPESS